MAFPTASILRAALIAVPLVASAQVPATPVTTPATVAAPSAPTAGSPAEVKGALIPVSPETVLIKNDVTSLTRGDYDFELTRLPADARGGFGADPQRVNAVLGRMLVTKTMAAEARAAGLDKLPEMQKRVAWETERLLAGFYIEHIDAEAAREFDARPGMEAAARERYLADKDKFVTPERASVTHILFDLQKHDKAEALKLAEEARAKILAGADMNALAREISEDPSAKGNDGRIEDFVREQMDPAFARAAFALKNPGDLSEPVLSRFGYHLIRLDRKQPSVQRSFAEVKAIIIAQMRAEYVEKKRNERFAAVRNDPKIVVNEPAVESLVIRYDPEAVKKLMEQAKAMKPASEGNAAGGAAK